MQQLEDDYSELYDALNSKIGAYRRDTAVSGEALSWICDLLIADLTKWKMLSRKHVMKSDGRDGRSGGVGANVQTAVSSITDVAGDMKKYGILKILASNTRPTPLDAVISGLQDMGLAGDMKRTSIVSMLSRLRKNSGLVTSPFEGTYELTAEGQAAYAQISQPLASKSAK